MYISFALGLIAKAKQRNCLVEYRLNATDGIVCISVQNRKILCNRPTNNKNVFVILSYIWHHYIFQDKSNEGGTLLNRYFVRNLKRTEMEAAYKFNFSNPKYLIMYNEDEKNKFGNSKGYRIVTDAMSKVLLPDEYRGFRSRAWTTYQVM